MAENALQLSTVEIDKSITRIEKEVSKISKGYINIAGDVAKLYDSKAYKEKGYKNIYDMCANLFGMARGTVSNLRNINERFCIDYKINPLYNGYSMRALLTMIELKVTDEEVALLNITSDLSAAEITAIIKDARGIAIEDKESANENESESESVNESANESENGNAKSETAIQFFVDIKSISADELYEMILSAYEDSYEGVIITLN